jgi:hypothetical protein
MIPYKRIYKLDLTFTKPVSAFNVKIPPYITSLNKITCEFLRDYEIMINKYQALPKYIMGKESKILSHRYISVYSTNLFVNKYAKINLTTPVTSITIFFECYSIIQEELDRFSKSDTGLYKIIIPHHL